MGRWSCGFWVERFLVRRKEGMIVIWKSLQRSGNLECIEVSKVSPKHTIKQDLIPEKIPRARAIAYSSFQCSRKRNK